MKVKKRDLRKGLPQIPINYPGPDVVPFDYDAERGRVENLCKRLADSEVDVRDAVLADLPRYLKDVCEPFIKDGQFDAAAAAAVEKAVASTTTPVDAGREAWALLLADDRAANLALIFEKLCLGLYYCMWHSDKPLVQHECAQKIADLVQAPPTDALRELFIRSMFRTLAAHWGKIDQYRMDKYMAMVRKIVARVLSHLVATVQRPLAVASSAAAANENAAAAAAASLSSSSPSSRKKKATTSSSSTGSSSNKAAAAVAAAPTAAAVAMHQPADTDDVSPTACSQHPSLLRVGGAIQWEVIRHESVGLCMHLCDLFLAEMTKCRAMAPGLFIAVAAAVPLYAMQRGDYIEKRVMDHFIVPIAAGQLEKSRSNDFIIETATILSAQLQALSVSRQTHFKVRPLMVESSRIIDHYVGAKLSPDEYEPVSTKDSNARIAAEVSAAEDVKMRMGRLAQKHAAAAGAVRAVRRAGKPTQPTSKRNARWKKL